MKLWLASCMLSILVTATLHAETYVTLEKVDLDRCASAWLISRFLDEDPSFVFFQQGTEPPKGVGYDFFGAEYFHHGPDCTYMTLIKRKGFTDNRALLAINHDVNDVFAWRWSPGSFPIKLREHIALLREMSNSDNEVYELIFPVFDLLYLKYGGDSAAFIQKGKRAYQSMPMALINPALSYTARANLSELNEFTMAVTPKDDEKVSADALMVLLQKPVEEWNVTEKKAYAIAVAQPLVTSRALLDYALSQSADNERTKALLTFRLALLDTVKIND